MSKATGFRKVKRRLLLFTTGAPPAPPSIMQLLAFPQHESVRDSMLLLFTAAGAGQAYVPLQIVAETTLEALFRYVVSAFISL
jgi:hypothetical protein